MTNNDFDPGALANPYSSPGATSFNTHAESGNLGKYAGFWVRFVAIFVDGMVVGAVSMILWVIVLVALFISPKTLTHWLGVEGVGYLIVFGFSMVYFAGQEASGARATIGKRALGLVVTDKEGNRLSFARAAGRWAAHGISNILLLIGYVIQPFTRHKQALHDILSGTVVRYKQEKSGGKSEAVIVAVVAFFLLIVIVGILAAIAIPQFSEYQNKALIKGAQSDARNAATSLMEYSKGHSEPPISIDELQVKNSPNVQLELLTNLQGVKATITKEGNLHNKSIAYVIQVGEAFCITDLPEGKAPQNCEIQEPLYLR